MSEDRGILWPDTDERRRATRFGKEPDSDSAVVWQEPGAELLVTVHDESLGGICLVLRDIGPFAVGKTATIVYHTEVMEAIVRNIRPHVEDTFLVGFECHHCQDQTLAGQANCALAADR
jgi:hypothetical protein